MANVNVALLGMPDAGKSSFVYSVLDHFGSPKSYDKISDGATASVGAVKANFYKATVKTSKNSYTLYDFVSYKDCHKTLISQPVKFDYAILAVNPTDGILPAARAQIKLAVDLGIKSFAVYCSRALENNDFDFREMNEMEIEDNMGEYGLDYQIFWGDSDADGSFGSRAYIDELFAFLDDAERASAPRASKSTRKFYANIYKLARDEGGDMTFMGSGAKVSVSFAKGNADATMELDGAEMLFPGDYCDVTIATNSALSVKERDSFTISKSGSITAIGIVKEVL